MSNLFCMSHGRVGFCFEVYACRMGHDAQKPCVIYLFNVEISNLTSIDDVALKLSWRLLACLVSNLTAHRRYRDTMNDVSCSRSTGIVR